MAYSEQRVYNINVGVLGHVDSGKTSLSRALSTQSSTACFDKNPQSRERGITLDLGFSSFQMDLPDAWKDRASTLQYTLVDCPGHASLIKTIIGGAQIIDIMVLVIDANKGIQTQTAECIVIGEMLCPELVVVLNKCDLIPEEEREKHLERMRRGLRKTFSQTRFSTPGIVCCSAAPGADKSSAAQGIDELRAELLRRTPPPGTRDPPFRSEKEEDQAFLMYVDHCFHIKGQGSVLTGTVLNGAVSVGSMIDFPEHMQQRKVKSIEAFHRPVQRARKGDRVGMCVTQFDAGRLERGMVCAPGHASVRTYREGIARVERVRFFKAGIPSGAKFHMTVGHSTVMAVVKFLCTADQEPPGGDWGAFQFGREYYWCDELPSEPDAEAERLAAAAAAAAAEAAGAEPCAEPPAGDAAADDAGAEAGGAPGSAAADDGAERKGRKGRKGRHEDPGAPSRPAGPSAQQRLRQLAGEVEQRSAAHAEEAKKRQAEILALKQRGVELSKGGQKKDAVEALRAAKRLGEAQERADQELAEWRKGTEEQQAALEKEAAEEEENRKRAKEEAKKAAAKAAPKPALKGQAAKQTQKEAAAAKIEAAKAAADRNCAAYIPVAQKRVEGRAYYALIQFERPLTTPVGAILIGSKLDTDPKSDLCRLCFQGHMDCAITKEDIPRIIAYKEKARTAVVEKVLDEHNCIGTALVSADGGRVEGFVGMKMLYEPTRDGAGRTPPGQHPVVGTIEAPFGTEGKFKLHFNEPVFVRDKHGGSKYATGYYLALRFKVNMFDKGKKMVQPGL